MKNLFLLIFSVSLFSNLFAGGGGSSISFPIGFSTLGTSLPTNFSCPTGGFLRSNLSSGPAASAPTACGLGTCAGAFPTDVHAKFLFKNTSLQPECYRIRFVETSGTSPTDIAYGGVGDIGFRTACPAPATINKGEGTTFLYAAPSFEIDVPGCTEFTVAVWHYTFFGRPGGSYNMYVENTAGGTANVGCAGAECVKTLTIGGTQVPTMTQWGLFLFGLIVLTLGVVAVFNMSRKSSNETAR